MGEGGQGCGNLRTSSVACPALSSLQVVCQDLRTTCHVVPERPLHRGPSSSHVFPGFPLLLGHGHSHREPHGPSAGDFPSRPHLYLSVLNTVSLSPIKTPIILYSYSQMKHLPYPPAPASLNSSACPAISLPHLSSTGSSKIPSPCSLSMDLVITVGPKEYLNESGVRCTLLSEGNQRPALGKNFFLVGC